MALETIAPDAPTNEEAFRAYIATKENPSEFLTAVVHPTTQAFWDFDAMGLTVESANIGRAKFVKEQIEFETKEKQKDKDTQQDVIDIIEDQREARQRSQQELYDNFGYQDGIYTVGGKVFSEEVLDDNIKQAEDDPATFARETGIEEDEVPTAMALMTELRGVDQNDPEAIAGIYDKYPPHIREAVLDKLEKDHTFDLDRKKQAEVNKSEVEAKSELSQKELEDKDKLADAKAEEFGFDDFNTATPTSLAKAVDQVPASASDLKLNSEYNQVAQVEAISIADTVELDNPADYQVANNDLPENKPIEISIG